MSQDELAEIDGIKPNVVLNDGEEKEVGSQSSKSVYKVKRTFDHYFCSCPAWRNQKGHPVNARTCKHLKQLFGDKYEAARLKLKNPDGQAADDTSSSKKKPAAKAKAPAKTAAKRKKADDDEEDEEEEKPAKKAKGPASKRRKAADDEEEEEKPAKKPASKARAKPASKAQKVEEDEDKKPASRRSARKPPSKAAASKATSIKEEDDAMAVDEEEEEAKQEAREESHEPAGGADEDELAEIDGIKPKVVLPDGEEREVKSQSSSSTYKVKRTWDHYYCTCPAWRNQGGVPVNARTCKHLQSLFGAEYEAARVKMKNPDGPAPKAPAKKAAKKPASKKAKKGDDDEEEDEEEDAPAGKEVPDLLLANKWDIETGPDPTGWWISEKLDGVRTYYDGTRMISRLGNPFTPPQWFLEKLPKDVTLDGELFGGRQEFQSTVSVVKTINSPHWKKITFQVFDIPSKADEPFEDRIAFLKELFGENGTHASEYVVVVEHEEATDRQHVLDKLKEVEGLGGEGLMLRKPASVYEGKRSSTLLKIKTFYDAEAVVTGYAPGKGKHAGSTGALKCKMASGKTFNVGTGLSDKQRKSPPKVGAIIVYRFQELTKDGVPRFPSYIGEAIDKTEPKDAEVPEHRKAGAKASDS